MANAKFQYKLSLKNKYPKLKLEGSCMKDKNKKNAEKIQFSVGTCSLGSAIIGVSELGLCATFLGNSPLELENILQSRFPNATLVKGDTRIDKMFLEVVELIDNPSKKIDLPIDERGTSFQLSVWKALREIPVGITMCYKEVANK